MQKFPVQTHAHTSNFSDQNNKIARSTVGGWEGGGGRDK